MTGSKKYYPLNFYLHRLILSWKPATCFMLLLLFLSPGYSQQETGDEEVLVVLNVQRIGNMEMPVMIRNDQAYLPITDLFDYIKIKNSHSPGFDSVSGFFITPEAVFLVDKQQSRIIYQDKIFELKPGDLIHTETNLYLKSEYFGQVFGLDCRFSFRSLSVSLTTTVELPAIREMRQELMRQNSGKLKGEMKADTTIKRNFPLFKLGMADWSVVTTQHTGIANALRLNLGLGGVVAGGETNVFLNYSNTQPFIERQQYYLWRYVNNDSKVLRQVAAGKIQTQSISSIFAPVVGVQFTNTPTTHRQSFGTYRLSDVTEPGWMVELYVNNVMINYMKADPSGFFTFDVPLVYGNSLVKLRFYGPWGEERTKEQYIAIPFNFLPRKELEYTVSVGVVEDGKSSRFSKTSVNYGLANRITIGGGVEYLSSVSSGEAMPFLTASMRVASSLLFSGEYTNGVRSRALVSYRMPSNLQFLLSYTKYAKGQTAIMYNYLSDFKAIVTKPFRGKNFTAFSRLTLTRNSLPKMKSTVGELLLSGTKRNISANVTTFGHYSHLAKPYLYTNLSFTFRLPSNFILTPQVQYDYRGERISMMKVDLDKYLFHNGFLNLSYQKNITYNINSFAIGLRYDFSFAQVVLSVRQSNKTMATAQSARGSIQYDSKTGSVGVSNRTSVGRGGILLRPYLDLNSNGQYDKYEPKVEGLSFHINGGRVQEIKNDTTVRVVDLEAYTNYFIKIDDNNLGNLAWKIEKKSIRVAIDPNQIKIVDVPVKVVGEVSGTVSLKNLNAKNGLGRITLLFYRSDSTMAGQTQTESDGFFSFFGLPAGSYTAKVDPTQMQKLNMVSTPEILHFNILATKDGDVVDGLEFMLQKVIDAIPASESKNNPGQKPARIGSWLEHLYKNILVK